MGEDGDEVVEGRVGDGVGRCAEAVAVEDSCCWRERQILAESRVEMARRRGAGARDFRGREGRR